MNTQDNFSMQYLKKINELAQLNKQKFILFFGKLEELNPLKGENLEQAKRKMLDDLEKAIKEEKEAYGKDREMGTKEIEIKVMDNNGKSAGSLSISSTTSLNGNRQQSVNSSLSNTSLSVCNGDIYLDFDKKADKIEISKRFKENLEIVRAEKVKKVIIKGEEINVIKQKQ